MTGLTPPDERRKLVALGAVVAALLCALVSQPSRAAAAARTVTYSTEWLGSARADYTSFRRIVAATLSDPRGWSLNGRIAFREVADAGDLTVALASPAAIAGFPSCSAYYSCRVGGHVLINSERWRSGTASYRGRALLHAYRQMVINHEVGHALGFGHVDCTRPGAPAAVMQQQSKGLGGCERNSWPLRGERAAYAAQVGVPAPAPPRAFAAGRRASHVRLGARRADVLATLGSPRRRVARDGGTRIDFYARPRVAVTYTRGRVIAISTRSRADVGKDGLAVGRRPAARMLRDCRKGARASRCRLEQRRRNGGRTSVVVRNGRIALMRVESGKRPRRSADTSGREGTRRSPRAPAARPTSADPLLGQAWNRPTHGRCAWWAMAVAARCG